MGDRRVSDTRRWTGQCSREWLVNSPKFGHTLRHFLVLKPGLSYTASRPLSRDRVLGPLDQDQGRVKTLDPVQVPGETRVRTVDTLLPT